MSCNGLRVLACIAVALAAPASFCATEGQAVQAVMLDHNEFPCENCLFGVADYYFCFAAGDKILIGRDKVRTDMRKHAPADLMQRGRTVSIRYDDRYIWIPQTKGKDLRLTQDYTRKIFLESDRCQAAVK